MQPTAEGSSTRWICLAGGAVAEGTITRPGLEDPFSHWSTAVLSSIPVWGLNAPGVEPKSECAKIGDGREGGIVVSQHLVLMWVSQIVVVKQACVD